MRRGRFLILGSLILVLALVALSVVLQSCAPPSVPIASPERSDYLSTKVSSYYDSSKGVTCYWLDGWPGETFHCIKTDS